MQNAIRPASEDDIILAFKTSPQVATTGSTDSTGEAGNSPMQSHGVIAQIDGLQKHVEVNLNIVRDPPFFPIATYQRADLIKRIRIIEEEVQQLAPGKSTKETVASGQLKDHAKDQEIVTALNKLFAFRDRVKNSGPPSPHAEIKPGSLLAVEV